MVASRQFAPRQNQLRARGNLNYLQFINLVKNLWAEAHHDIPILPTGGNTNAQYPVIVYGLELRKPHQSDPKRRYRELVFDEDKAPYVVSSQRFDNIISFTSVTENEPILAEEIIERFEDFMQEIVPILKELGTSEVAYSRRYADQEENRASQGINTRKVAYLVTLEKTIATKREKIDNMLINVRRKFTDVDKDYPFWSTHDPRFYTPSCFFGQNEDDLRENLITVPKSWFRIGDRIYLMPITLKDGFKFPPMIDPGYYVINNIVGEPYSSNIKYELTDDNGNLVDFYDEATPPGLPAPDEDGGIYYGRILFDGPENVEVSIFDSYSHATPYG